MSDNGKALIPQNLQQPTMIAPRSLDEAVRFASLAHRSGLLPKSIATAEAATMVLLKGLELGLTPMQAFAGINVIQGKAECGAELLLALCTRSPECLYFRLIESTDKSATFETHRRGSPEPTPFSFTFDMATAMGLTGRDNWHKQPATMLRWRAISALAKMVYPDLVLGMYGPGEISGNESAVTETPAPIVILDAIEPPAEPRNHEELAKPWLEKLSKVSTKKEALTIGKEFGDKDPPHEVRLIVGAAYADTQAKLKKEGLWK